MDELGLAKAAAAEWLQRYEDAERRITAVWNAALHEARMRLGHHNPPCFSPCIQCWFYEEINKMMRGDPNNYIPVLERAKKSVAKMNEKFSAMTVGAYIEDPEKAMADAYLRGLNDMLSEFERMLARNE